MELTKKEKQEKERRRFERKITKWLNKWLEGCEEMKHLADSIDKMCERCKMERRLDYSGNERKDITKKIRKGSKDNE